MPGRHPPEVRRQAIALARAGGAEFAATQLGIQARTIRGWLSEAGDPPELDGTAEGWRRLLDLAQAKVESALTSGRMRPTDMAIVAGIAERNLAKLEDRRQQPEVPDELAVWIDARYATARERAMAHDAVTLAIVQRLRADPSEPIDVEAPPDPEQARAVTEWAIAHLEGIGDLEVHLTTEAEREASYRERGWLVAARAEVLHRDGGATYHEALRLAEEITE
jgi:hypothetical protein